MKQLEKNFIGRGQVKGFMFTQIKKSNHGYIYMVEADGLIHYEVLEHRTNTRFNCVSYPSDKAFGIWAWTFRCLGKADDKLEEINQKGEAAND